MDLIKVVVIGATTVLLALELKTHKPVLTMILGMTGSILIMVLSLDKIVPIFEQVQSVLEYLGDGRTYFTILLKVLGVTYLCQFTAGICKDAGFGSLSEQIQVFGKMYIMLSGMPILMAFIDTIRNL